MVYVLLDGVGDLPHPDLDGATPLEAAHTPNLDSLCQRGVLGEVISVGKRIAPESDIAVFNMLGYRFTHAEYVGRGVIESIGLGIDFRDGDVALRGNFATLDQDDIITDRRAGRQVDPDDANAISKEIERNVKFDNPDASVMVVPTIGHRLAVRFRAEALSGRVTNTDPAYTNVNGMGIAKATGDTLRIERCLPMISEAEESADMINEFTQQSVQIMEQSEINRRRDAAGLKRLSCILLRDAGDRYPIVEPIDKKYGMRFACIVDMPVEQGIAKVLKMEPFEAGKITDYIRKASVAAGALDTQDAVYVHIKGPDEFGHDGDALGKTANIEEIDKFFFGPLLERIDLDRTAVVVSADHSTPCINNAHSDDPVPLLVSGIRTKPDTTTRMTENQAKQGRVGLLYGFEVLAAAIDVMRAQR